MNIRDYHRHPGIGSTALGYLRRSPAHFRAYMAGELSIDDTAGTFGDAFHAFVLEPHRFEREFVVEHIDRRTKNGKARAEELAAEGVRAISPEDGETMERMRGNLLAHPGASRVLGARTHVEEPIFWDDPTTGVACKCRPDVRLPRLLADLKTTRDASPAAFAKAIANYGYHIQAAHYIAGCRAVGHDIETFVFLAVEKEPPHAVGVYVLSPGDLAAAESKRIELLDLLATCRAEDRWPAYSDRIETIQLPPWAA